LTANLLATTSILTRGVSRTRNRFNSVSSALLSPNSGGLIFVVNGRIELLLVIVSLLGLHVVVDGVAALVLLGRAVFTNVRGRDVLHRLL
jgi:hypothetical protein